MTRLYINTAKNISYFYLSTSSYINLRMVCGAKYVREKDIWVFPAIPPYHEWVIEDLQTVLEDVELDEKVTRYLDTTSKLESKAVSGDTRGFASKFTPYKHQKQGLARIMFSPRCAIFWDPGMGKTKLICDRILYQRSLDPTAKCLILALRVNLSTWVSEMDLHSDGAEKIVSLAAPNPAKRKKLLEKAKEDNAAGVVCTYETARVSLELLAGYNYTMIVADECHKMQSYKSKLTKAALALSKSASYRYVLSGTPTKGKPTDVWASLRFLGEFVVPKYWDFDSEYVKRAHYNRHIVTGYKNLDALNDLLSHISDTKKAEDCLDLPERTFQTIYVAPSSQQRTTYNKIVKDKEGLVQVNKEDIPVGNLLTKLGKLSQVCSGFVYKSLKDPTICDKCPNLRKCVKEEISPYTGRCSVVTKDPGNKVIRISGKSPMVDSCVELCSAHLENGKKVIVWARHVEMLDSLFAGLSSSFGSESVLRYDSTAESPGEVERQFNTDPSKKIILAQITMGIGVTFKAPIMIYTELSFNLADWLQSLDRNWGIRAKGLGPILVQVLLVRGSIYEQAYSLLQRKIDVASIIKDKPNCAACEKILDCLAKNIEPYDRECILSSSVDSVTLKLKELK